MNEETKAIKDDQFSKLKSAINELKPGDSITLRYSLEIEIESEYKNRKKIIPAMEAAKKAALNKLKKHGFNSDE